MLERFAGGAGRTAIPSFAGAAVAGISGSPTLGGLAGSAAGGATSALAGLGSAATAATAGLAGVVIGGTALMEVFRKLSAKATEMARTVEDLSPHVARASALAEVRLLQDRLRRAERLGPQLADWTMAKSEFQSEWNRLQDTLMREIVPVLTELMRFMTFATKVGEQLLPLLPEFRALQGLRKLIEEFLGMKRDQDLEHEIELFFTRPEIGLRGTLLPALQEEGGF